MASVEFVVIWCDRSCSGLLQHVLAWWPLLNRLYNYVTAHWRAAEMVNEEECKAEERNKTDLKSY